MASYDVLLDENGDLPIATYHGNGAEAVVQRVLFRLQIWLGEWVLNINKGLPFGKWLREKEPRAEVVGAILKREILGTPGVLRILRWEGAFIREHELLHFSAELLVQDGDAQASAEIAVYPVGTSGSNASPTAVYLNHISRSIVR